MDLTALHLLERDSAHILEACEAFREHIVTLDSSLDCSTIAVGYFKILEIELHSKVFQPFSISCRRVDTPSVALYRPDQARHVEALDTYLRDGSSFPLGSMLGVLQMLGRAEVTANKDGDLLYQLKHFLRSSFARPYFFYGKSRLAERLSLAVQEYRNPCAHLGTLSISSLAALRREMLGEGNYVGMLPTVLRCLKPATPSPRRQGCSVQPGTSTWSDRCSSFHLRRFRLWKWRKHAAIHPRSEQA